MNSVTIYFFFVVLYCCMKVNKALDKFVNSSMLSASIFVGSGAYKTYKDYKNSDEKYKNKFLLKDTVVLSGAALGMLANRSASREIERHKYFKKAAKSLTKYLINHKKLTKPFLYTEKIVKDLMSNFLMFSSGILGALGADYLLSKTGFEQPENNIQIEEQNKIVRYFDETLTKNVNTEIKEAVYSRITDMPQMNVFTTSLIGSQAIDLSKDREFDKRLKNTTKCLINNSLMPLFFLSTSSALTKHMKAGYRIPIIFSTLVGGTMLTNKIVEKMNDK